MTRAGQSSTVRRPNVLGKAEARDRAALVSGVRYRIVLDVTADDSFSTVTVIDFDASFDADVFVDYGGTPALVECNGVAFDSSSVDGSRIRIPARRGANRVRITGSSEYGNAGVGLHRFRDPRDGAVYLHTKFQPFDAHRVFPCFDQPDIRATFHFTVIADAGWQVVANTPVESRSFADGSSTWTFKPTLPIATYLTSVAAGPFASRTTQPRRSGLPISFYARPSLIDAVDRDINELADTIDHGLDHFAELFGRSYPFGKLDIVFAPEYTFGAMEHPGAITANERFAFTSRVTAESRRRRSEVLLHELAHMWFGNLVGIRWWDDLWLSESFAVWAAAHAQAHTVEHALAWTWFAHDAVVTARHADSLPARQPVALTADDTAAARLGFSAITYRKGAALLRQLARQMGEDSFIAGLRRYVERHAWGNADLTDLVAALDAVGQFDVAAWVDSWLRSAGVAAVTATASTTGVRVTQSTDTGVAARSFPLDIDVYRLGEGTSRRMARATAEIEGSEPVEVHLPVGALSPDAIIPNPDGVIYVQVRLDDRSRDAALNALASVPEPTTRAVVWSSLWEDVKNARLRTGRFVTCVLDHSAAEADDGITELLWTRAVAAVQEYGDPSAAEARLRGLHAAAARRIADSSAGSDAQLVGARLAAATINRDQVDGFPKLLPGQQPWPGLVVDDDLMWRYLSRLAVIGGCSDDLLAAALESDPSWDGHCRSLTVRAARPTAGAKREAWDIAVDDSRSITERRAAMAGMRQYGQGELLAPYAERYFDMLTAVWDTAEPEFAIAFSRLLYPRTVTDAAGVLATTERIIADNDHRAELVAILRDERAELAAMVAARAYDAGGAIAAG